MKIINSNIPTIEEIMTAYGFQKDSEVWHLTVNEVRVGAIQEDQLLIVYPEKIFSEIGSFIFNGVSWKSSELIQFTLEDTERIYYGLLCEWKKWQYFCDAQRKMFVQAEIELPPRITVVKFINDIPNPPAPRLVAKAFIKWDYPGGTNSELYL